MRFMAQFDLLSDVSSAGDEPEFEIVDPHGQYWIKIRKSFAAETEGLDKIRCNMEFEAPDLENSKDAFDAIIFKFLDILALTTHAVIKFDRVYKIFDWSPGLSMRRGLFYIYDPPVPEPAEFLGPGIAEATNILLWSEIDEKVLTALRWFRLGILEESLLAQFQSFWFALELLAQHKKSTAKVSDLCSKCGKPLYCEACEEYPKHRPFPKQAIFELCETLVPENPEFFPVISKTRNALLHGERAGAIKDIVGYPLENIIDPLAQATWNGLLSEVLAGLPKEQRPDQLNIGQATTFVQRKVSAIATIETIVPNDENGNPDIELLTGISVTFTGGARVPTDGATAPPSPDS